MANILTWISMGRPQSRSWSSGGYKATLPQAVDKTPWKCDTVAEKQVSRTDLNTWLNLRPGCAGAHRATAGLQYSESLHGFVGSGVTAPDATTLRQAPEARQISTNVRSSPVQTAPAISAPAPTAAPAMATTAPAFSAPGNGGTMIPRRTASLSSLGGIGAIGGTFLGGPIGGTIGGTIGGSFAPGGTFGKSKCPGPFNFNPATGGCDPKPGSFAGPTCPPGTTWDASAGQCRKGGVSGWIEETLPGGKTGYVDPMGWSSTTAYGTQGVVPQSRPSSTLICPRGYVLYGKEGGMEVCMPKGVGLPNKLRKWPKTATPALSAQDMKTLRRIGTLQKRIKRVAQTAGYKGLKL